MEITLGVDPSDLGEGDSSFVQLGGDSLAAIQFTREVNDACGVEMPVSFVLDHSHTVVAIIEKVLPSATVHGKTGLLVTGRLLIAYVAQHISA